MKIRTDYVTNSSSSSYVFAYIKSKKVAKLLQEFETELSTVVWNIEHPNSKDFSSIVDRASDQSGLFISKDSILYADSEADSIICESFSSPYNQRSIITSVVRGLRRLAEEWRYEDWFADETEEHAEVVERIAQKFEDSEDELLNDVEECRFESGRGAWAGDFSYDYSCDGLSEDLLKKVIPEIVEEKKYSGADEVTDDDISEFVITNGLFSSDYYTYTQSLEEERIGETESAGCLEVERVKIKNLKIRRELFDFPDEIACIGKTFVTTFLDPDDETMIAEDVTSRGGFVRGAVSGRTNYLIALDEGVEGKKMSCAIEQKGKGKDIQIITLAHYLKLKEEGNLN